MNLIRMALVLTATFASAAYADCSYIITDRSVWDYAPGTLTLDGQTYRCENDFSTIGIQRCQPNSLDMTETLYAYVNAESGTVQVFRDADDPTGTHVCNGPAR